MFYALQELFVRSGRAQRKSNAFGCARRLPLVLVATLALVPLAGCASNSSQSSRLTSLCERTWTEAGANGGKADRYSAPTVVAPSCSNG
jgi:hypothetical protein